MRFRPGVGRRIPQLLFEEQRMNVTELLDLIRGLPVEDARVTLQFTNRRAAEAVAKVLDSAVANAEHNNALDVDLLYVAEAYAGEGPTLKRWRPRARGRATRINKRTSHITIVVADEEELEGAEH